MEGLPEEAHQPPALQPRTGGGFARLTERLLDRAALVMVVPVLVLLLGALTAFIYGFAFFVHTVATVIDHPFPIAHNIGLFVVLVDLFLVGVTLFIAAMGVYELFLRPEWQEEPSNLLPPWLVMRDLNDLKARVLSMIVLVAAVTFIDLVVNFQTGRDALYFGSGIALVIAAITVFLRFGAREHGP